MKISLFCHNKYDILGAVVIKLIFCAECSRFYNTLKPGTKIVLHSVILTYVGRCYDIGLLCDRA